MVKNQKALHDKHWKNFSKTADIVKERGPLSRHVLNILTKLLSRIEFITVLDVGCGQGSRLALVQRQCPKMIGTGVDFSKVALGLAKVTHPEFSYKLLDISKQSLKTKYDLVLCLDVIEHIEDDRQALKNLRKMTRKYMILSTIKGRMRRNEPPGGHVRNYTYPDLKEKIESAGFSIIDSTEWGFPFYSPIYRDALEFIYLFQEYLYKTRKINNASYFEDSIPFLMKLVGEIMHQIMKINNVTKRGDLVFILAKSV